VNPGVRPEGVSTLRVSLPTNRYRDQASWRRFQTRVLERAVSMPGIASVAIINRLPFDGGIQTAPLTVQGKSREEQVLDQADMRFVSPDYFQTVGIRLSRGRPFADADNEDAPLTIILDEVLARRYFGSGDPVGRAMKMGGIDSKEPWRTVVGVVSTVLGDGLDSANRGQAYLPYRQITSDRFAIVATAKGGQAVDAALREAVRYVDPNQAVFASQTLSSVMDATLGPRRFPLLLLSFFAVTALLLAGSGMYSVISYGVNQRTQEIGIRMALGAGSGSVLRMVLAEAGRLALAGTLIGLAGSALLSSTIRSLLFQVGALDAGAYAGACFVVLATTALAGVLPARRAARLDPYVAIRND
jgi:putative ABC transport system permease protein